MIIVDTNVVSELMKAAPSSSVVAWIRTHDADELRTTSITLAEIGYGIVRLPEGARRTDPSSSRRLTMCAQGLPTGSCPLVPMPPHGTPK